MTRIVALSPVRKARRGGKGKPSQAALEALQTRMSAIVHADLLGGFRRIKGSANYDAMARAVYSGDYRKVMRNVPLKGVADSVRRGMRRVANAYSEATGIAADKVPIGALRDDGKDHSSISLRPDNPKVQSYVDTRSGELIQNVTEDIQRNVQTAVKRGMANDSSPKDVADEIKQNLVLDERRANALTNYSDGLREKGYPQAQIDKLSAAYEDRLLDQRAITIARTEVAYAQNAGQMEVWNDAVEKGWLPEGSGRSWQVDGDPCPICQSLDGQVVGMDEVFRDDDGEEYDSPPAHPHCRCCLSLVFGST